MTNTGPLFRGRGETSVRVKVSLAQFGSRGRKCSTQQGDRPTRNVLRLGTRNLHWVVQADGNWRLLCATLDERGSPYAAHPSVKGSRRGAELTTAPRRTG